jgi:multidrug transporter EmrE-like cation transporter
MSTRGIYLIILAAFMTVGGNLMMREGVVRAGGLALAPATFVHEMRNLLLQPFFDAGVLLYGLASIVWFGIVSTENLNSSYPLLVSVTFIFVTLGATVLFREPLPWQKVAGIAVILGGIVMVSRAG